jgi:hypothetical protein
MITSISRPMRSLQALGADLGLQLHQPLPALFLDSSGTGSGSALAGAPSTGEYWKQPTRSSSASSRKSSSSSNSASVSPGEADDEGAAQREVRAGLAPGVDALQHALGVAGALHQLEDARAACWNGMSR